MADDVILNSGAGGDTVAADDIGGKKYQRVKLIHGADGTNAGDIASGNPLPVTTPDSSAAGNITAADAVVSAPTEDGVPVSGTPTANSYIACASPGGDVSFAIQLLGTVSGIYYIEISFDSTNGVDGNWIATKAKQAGKLDEPVDWKTTLKGIYRGNFAGATYVRVRNRLGSAFTTNVTITTSAGVGGIFLTAPLPAGIKNIGRVTVAETLPPNLQQLSIEGYPIIGVLRQTTGFTPVSDNASILTGTIQFADLGAGKGAYVDEIIVTSSGGAGLTWANILNTGPFTFDPATETMYGEIPVDGGVVIQKVGRYCLEGSNLVVAITTLNTGRRPKITVQIRGISYTDDYNWDAKSLLYWIGTSNDGNNLGIDPATTVRYRNHWIHAWQLRDLMLDNGKSIRFINKAVVASESAQWSKAIRSGIIGGINYDCIVVNLGINDVLAGSNITTTQFEANLKDIIIHRNRFRPEASIIFMTPTPTDTAVRSGIGPYRTSVATVANDATLGTTARRVYLCDVFAQWVTSTGQASGLNPVAASDLNFNDAERSAGNRLHPSGAGMNITVIALWATMQTTHYYQKLA